MRFFQYMIVTSSALIHTNRFSYCRSIQNNAIRRGRDGKIYIGEPETEDVIKKKIREVLEKLEDIIGGPNREPELQPIPIPVEDYPEQDSYANFGKNQI